MRAYERLLKYVRIHTTSDEDSLSIPSTDRQKNLAKIIKEELENLGVDWCHMDDKGYIYARLDATKGKEDEDKIGFIAHLDTAPDFSGENVVPIIHENYNGEDVVLNEGKTIIKISDFPHLVSLKGKTLITSDGTTLLGADDKAGISEIITMVEMIKENNIEHGDIKIAFTPDEEIGRGADYFDIEKFGADYAYTVDGSMENAIEYENFNAASCKVEIKGVSIHPGDAKGKMINASMVAIEYANMLPKDEVPEKTEGYEGFYHLTDIKSDVSKATLEYIIRDHDSNKFDEKCKMIERIAGELNARYGSEIVKVTIKEQYRNMIDVIKENMHVVARAKRSIKKANLECETVAIRGGTDGARLSFMNLPCPNIGTGGYAFHGPYEHITAEAMDKVCEILINIVEG